MTQIFANITSLAEFLVSQKDQTKPNADESSPITGFEDFLSGQMTINSPKDIQKSSDFGISTPIIEGAFEVSSKPILSMPNSAKPPVGQSSMNLEQALWQQQVVDANLIPTESVTPVQMMVSQLKLLASQQEIPLNLTVNRAELKNLLDSTLLQNAVDYSETKISTDILQVANLQSNQANSKNPNPIDAVLNQIQTNSSEQITHQKNPAALPRSAETATLSIDADRLLQTNEDIISASLNNQDSVPEPILVKVSELLKVINNNPESAFIQIKSNPDKAISQAELNPQSVVKDKLQAEKSYVVNLNTLMTAKDNDSISVLQKVSLPKSAEIVDSKNNSGVVSAPAAKADQQSSTRIDQSSVFVAGNAEIAENVTSTSRRVNSLKSEKPIGFDSQPVLTKVSNQEIQPIQSAKSGDNSLINIFSREHIIQQTSEFNGQSQPAAPSPEPSTFLAQHLKIFNQIKSQLQTANGNTQLTIQLKPESLGKIKVELKTEGDKLNATFRVDNPDVKRVLDAELPNLKHDWKIDNFRIETNMRNAEDGSGSFANRQNQARMADGQSSNSSSRTNRAENAFGNQKGQIVQIENRRASGRIDLFA
jgi:flagellar hook-length control protein FliK